MHSIASICPIIYSVSNQENPLTLNNPLPRRLDVMRQKIRGVACLGSLGSDSVYSRLVCFWIIGCLTVALLALCMSAAV